MPLQPSAAEFAPALPPPPAPNARPADFFISYSGVDRPWAVWIASILEVEQYTVILQAWDFRPGNNFVLMMDFATRAKHTLLVLSRAFMEAHFTQPEWARALADDPKGLKRRVIPIRVEPCEPRGLLSPIIYIDIAGVDEGEARARIIDGVRPGRAKPDARPPFPGSRFGM